MKDFLSLSFDPTRCRQELEEFRNFLAGKATLRERADILSFFRSRMHLSAFIGSYSIQLTTFDRIAFEYDIFGDFSADLVIGDSRRAAYCFVEFEDASKSSLFSTRRSRHVPEWSHRLEHGFSQIVDWLWKLDDMKGTLEYRDRFGHDEIRFEMMLIAGRSTDLRPREHARLRWRLDRVIVNSKRVHTVTLDELYTDLNQTLGLYEAAFAIGRKE